MTEQEAIKILEYQINMKNEDVYTPINYEAIETVLSMLKENSAEIEQKNTELAEKNAEIEKLKKFINYLQLKNIKDLDTKIYMANFINDNTPYTKDTKELENEEGIRTVDFTVKYFERKAINNG